MASTNTEVARALDKAVTIVAVRWAVDGSGDMTGDFVGRGVTSVTRSTGTITVVLDDYWTTFLSGSITLAKDTAADATAQIVSWDADAKTLVIMTKKGSDGTEAAFTSGVICLMLCFKNTAA